MTEKGMRKDLPYFISDPANLAKVEALLQNGDDHAAEETRQLH